MSNPEVEEINSANDLINEDAKEIVSSENYITDIHPFEELSHTSQVEVNPPVSCINIPEKADELTYEIKSDGNIIESDEIMQDFEQIKENVPLNPEIDSVEEKSKKLDVQSNLDASEDIENLREEEINQDTSDILIEESKEIAETNLKKYDNSSVEEDAITNERNSNMSIMQPEENVLLKSENVHHEDDIEITSINEDSIRSPIEENIDLKIISQQDTSINQPEDKSCLVHEIEHQRDLEINSTNEVEMDPSTKIEEDFEEINHPDPISSQPEIEPFLNEIEPHHDLPEEIQEHNHDAEENDLSDKDELNIIQGSESMLEIPRKSESCFVSTINEECSPELAPEQTESNDSREIIGSKENTFCCYNSVLDENSISHDNLDEVISQSMIIHSNEADLSMKQSSRSSKQPNRAKTNLVSPKYSNKKINQSFKYPQEDEMTHPKKKAVNAAEAIAIGQSLYNKGKEFLNNRETKLEKIFTDTHSFKPTINSKSAKLVGGIKKEKNELYSDKIKRPKYVPEEEHKEKKKLKLNDFLNRNYAKPLEHAKEKKAVVPKEEVDEECTFAPKIDGKSKTIGSHRNLYDLAAEKKSKLDQKIQEAKMQKEKEELKECTFQPTVFKQIDTMKSPKNKFGSHSIFSDRDSFLNTIG